MCRFAGINNIPRIRVIEELSLHRIIIGSIWGDCKLIFCTLTIGFCCRIMFGGVILRLAQQIGVTEARLMVDFRGEQIMMKDQRFRPDL